MKITTTMRNTGALSARRAALITAAGALVIAAAFANPAAAHGRDTPNLKKYCATLFKLHKRPAARRFDRIDYYYSVRKRRWVCRLSFPHFRRGGGKLIRTFQAADACRWQFGTRRVHVHQGRSINGRPVLHCGVRRGLVRRYTKLTLCNRSHARVLHAAYAHRESARHPAGRGWKATGWVRIRHNTCQTVKVGRKGYRGSVYVFAEGGGYRWAGRDGRFCVNKFDGFKLHRADSRPCHRPHLTRVRMTEVRVAPGANRHIFTN